MRLVKRDRNHQEIKQALLAAGVRVKDVSHLPGMGCDIIATHRSTWAVFLEVKDGEKPPSARRLTDSELALRDQFPRAFAIVTTPEEALAAVGIKVG